MEWVGRKRGARWVGCHILQFESLGGKIVEVVHAARRGLESCARPRLLQSAKKRCLPDPPFLAKLIARNEDLVVSNHPLKSEIISSLGANPLQRRKKLKRVYDDAKAVLRITWSEARGYHPSSDAFYKRFLRSLST